MWYRIFTRKHLNAVTERLRIALGDAPLPERMRAKVHLLEDVTEIIEAVGIEGDEVAGLRADIASLEAEIVRLNKIINPNYEPPEPPAMAAGIAN